MSAGEYITIAIGWAAGSGFAGLLLTFRRNSWVRKAQNLAARSDMALPGPIVPKVARFLRDSWLFALLVSWIYIPLALTAIDDHYGRREWTRWLPWIVTLLPILLASFSYAGTVWPRWKASGSRRVTHLKPLRVRQAFTFSEASMTVVGAVIAAAAGGWGLWLASAAAWWWAMFAAACVVALVTWGLSAKAVMGRPSSASDAIELGWDDLIRFRRVREMTIGAAWLPALLIFLADRSATSQLSRTPQFYFSIWPFYVMIATGVVLHMIYQRGRRLWRQAWATGSESAESDPVAHG